MSDVDAFSDDLAGEDHVGFADLERLLGAAGFVAITWDAAGSA